MARSNTPPAWRRAFLRELARSGSVAQYMAQLGFKNVSNLAGGINLWSKQVDPSVPSYVSRPCRSGRKSGVAQVRSSVESTSLGS